jgi:hypothetical protein
MAKLLTGKGLTTNVNIASPPAGMKWVVKWAMTILHAGSTTGSRYVTIVIDRMSTGSLGQENPGPIIANTNGQTGTNITYSAIGDVSPQGFYNGGLTQFSQFPEVFSTDLIQTFTTIPAGDTYDYYILVEEVVA